MLDVNTLAGIAMLSLCGDGIIIGSRFLVIVRENVPQLVRNKFVDGLVYISSVSDSYQPIEKELEITRRVLENMSRRVRLRILTKTDLVFKRQNCLENFDDVEVGLTINSWSGKLKSELETFSPRMEDG